MRIILVESGTYETFQTLATQLVAMGHEVYDFCADKTVSQRFLSEGHTIEPFLDHPPDLVLTANFFHARDVNELIRLHMPGNFPVVNLTWGHPVSEIAPLWRNLDGVKACNAQLEKNRVFLWILCPFAAQEYRQLGFTNGFYAPLGGFGYQLAKGHLFRWMRWGEPFQDPKSAHPSQGPVHDLDPEAYDLVYLGEMPDPPPTADPALERLAQEEARRCALHPHESRSASDKLWRRLAPNGSIPSLERFLQFHRHFFHAHATLTRQRFVHRLAQEFDDKLLLYGDAWIHQGLRAQPRKSVARNHFYQRIPLSVDFGSTSFETCFFPRTIEIVKSGGTLLSYRRPDSSETFGRLLNAPVFDDEEQLIAQVNRLLKAPAERNRCREAQWQLVQQEQVAALGLATMVDHVFEGERPAFETRRAPGG
ncbi:MAG: glycosyltransferase family 1 protein [Magnetococcales bacterium]|nr:glycosyltransferase family 1 protein [Magnetococcales bacterium]